MRNFVCLLAICLIFAVSSTAGDDYTPVTRPNIPDPDNTFNPTGGNFNTTVFDAWLKGRVVVRGGSFNRLIVGVKPGTYSFVGPTMVFMFQYNVTIWMDGVTLVAPDSKKSLFVWEKSGPYELRGLTLTFTAKASHVAQITAVDTTNNQITAQVLQGYSRTAFESAAGQGEFNLFNQLGEMLAAPLQPQFYPTNHVNVDTDKFTWDIFASEIDRVQVGLLIGVPNAFSSTQLNPILPSFVIHESESVGFIDITVSNCAGTVFSERKGSGAGGNYYTRVKVTPGPPLPGTTRSPLYSATGPFVIQSQGMLYGSKIDHSLFENVFNDGVIVSATSAKVSSGAGGATLTLTVPEEWLVGDVVRFFNKDAQLLTTGTIKSLTTTTVTFNSNTPAATAYAADSSAASAGFRTSYSTFRYIGGHALIVAAPDAQITDCLVNATINGGIYAGPFFKNAGDTTGGIFPTLTWADYANNLVIQRVLFQSAGYRFVDGFAAITVASYADDGSKAAAAGGFTNVQIADNTIIKTSATDAIYVTSTQTLSLTGNNIVAPLGTTNVVRLEHVTNPTVTSNCVYVYTSDNKFYVRDGTSSTIDGIKDCSGQSNPNAPATSGTPSYPSKTDTPNTGIYASSSSGTPVSAGTAGGSATGNTNTGGNTASNGGTGSSPTNSNNGPTSSYTGNTVRPPTLTSDSEGRVTTTNPAIPDASGFYPPTATVTDATNKLGSASSIQYSLGMMVAMMVLVAGWI